MNRALQFLVQLGAAGPFLLGIADSSFLFLPFSNDLLLVTSVARKHAVMWTYVPIAALGSVAGVFLLDLISRRRGEAGLRNMTSSKRFEYLKNKMSQRAGFAVALACLAPPPFPFTPVVAAASAFQYSRSKLLVLAFFARLVRFSIVAGLALFFGDRILTIAKSRGFLLTMVAFIVICAAGSTYSVASWIRRSRNKEQAQ